MKPMNYWVEKLSLRPHPEGGFFCETYRSKLEVVVPGKIEKPHHVGTNIYYMLGNYSIGHFSSWHRLRNLDETWHFHYGSDITIYIIDTNGKLSINKLGAESNTFQVHVPANCWFAAAVENPDKDAYTLVGCTVFPGFDYEDFEIGKRESLIAHYPEHRAIIEKLTRE